MPSLTTWSLTPDILSKMTARVPPFTSYIEACPRDAAIARGTAYLDTALRADAMVGELQMQSVRKMLDNGDLERRTPKMNEDSQIIS